MNRGRTTAINVPVGCGKPRARSSSDKHGYREIVKEGHQELGRLGSAGCPKPGLAAGTATHHRWDPGSGLRGFIQKVRGDRLRSPSLDHDPALRRRIARDLSLPMTPVCFGGCDGAATRAGLAWRRTSRTRPGAGAAAGTSLVTISLPARPSLDRTPGHPRLLAKAEQRRAGLSPC